MFLIGCTVAAFVLVGRGLLTSRAENSQLKIHVAALKRQLAEGHPEGRLHEVGVASLLRLVERTSRLR